MFSIELEFGRTVVYNETTKKMERRELTKVDEKTAVIKSGFMAILGNPITAIILDYMCINTKRALDFDTLVEEGRERGEIFGVQLRLPRTDGWFEKTSVEVSQDCMIRLSSQATRLHIKKLVATGILEERRPAEKRPGKYLQYRVNFVELGRALAARGHKL